MAEFRLVVGLGNPGRKYSSSRHNIGFMVIDILAETLGIKLTKRKFGARIGSGDLAGKKLILLKPWLFMNLSGKPVAEVVSFYRLSINDVLTVLDDMVLEPGRIRIRAKGSAGGHNGLENIIEELGTNQFPRLRIGIGKCPDDSAVDYVLDRPTSTEKQLLDEAIQRARDAVLCWAEFGIQRAMNEFNKTL